MKTEIKISVAAAILSLFAAAQIEATIYAASAATSQGSDWFGSDSGWVTETASFGYDIPKGNWDLKWAHNYTVGKGLLQGSIPIAKPAKEDWGPAVNDIARSLKTDNQPTSDSNCTSNWKIDHFKNPAGPTYHALVKTLSEAWCSGATTQNQCTTWVEDPWIFDSPDYDAEGRWTLGGSLALWGSIEGEGRLGWEYSIVNNPMDPLNSEGAWTALDIEITDEVSVMIDPAVRVFVAGVEKTAGEIETFLSGYFDAEGQWNLSPAAFDFDGFDPTNSSHLSEVFNLDYFIHFDADTVASASVFTRHLSEARAAIPEPSLAALMSVFLIVLFCLCRRNRA